MTIRDILLLGNPQLYERSEPVAPHEGALVEGLVADLHDTLMDFRRRHGAGRAIAAPQIGVKKRLLYMHIGEPTVFINPVLVDQSPAMFMVWDDCLCFPDLLVKVRRHRTCRIRYRDTHGCEHERFLEDDLSELLQHEYDHLDGILAVSRAVDGRSFALRGQKPE